MQPFERWGVARTSPSRNLINSYPKIASYRVGYSNTTFRDAGMTTRPIEGEPIRVLTPATAGTPFGNLTTTNDTTAPVMRVGGFNGRDCAEFTTDDFLRNVLATATPVGAATVFWVGQSNAVSGDSTVFYMGQVPGSEEAGNTKFKMVFNLPATVWRVTVCAGNWHQGNLNSYMGIPIVISMEINSVERDLWLNGLNDNSSVGDTPDPGTLNMKTFGIGCSDADNRFWKSGLLRECEVISGVLTNTEVQALRAAYAADNGIVL